MVRWRYVQWLAKQITADTAAAARTSFGSIQYDVIRFATNQRATVNWHVDEAHNYAHLKPEFSLVFATVGGSATGVADWHVIDRQSIGDGVAWAAPNHDNKLPHTVTVGGTQIWITPYVADASVVTWTPGEWVPINIERQAGLDTIADTLDLFSVSMRYRVRG